MRAAPPCSVESVPVKSRRRPNLIIPLPPRDTSLALPLPLPPTNFNSSGSSPSHDQKLSYSDLDRKERIGSGAGGTVYRVLHRPTNTLYALKVIITIHEESLRRQVYREIEILRTVSHPNVVICHEMFNQSGEIQMLLEFMDSGSLEGVHVSDEVKLAALTRQILNGLVYLHNRHIVHRDIKPSNLLVNGRREVKISDFGVSRILEQTMDLNSSVGTIAYMSPERINTDLNHGRYDGYAGDIWSLGVSVLEFYLGKYPFKVARHGEWASLMVAICMTQPPEAPATSSREFRDFVSCCLQRDPRRRWSAQELLSHPFIAGCPSQVSLKLPNLHQLTPPPRPIVIGSAHLMQ